MSRVQLDNQTLQESLVDAITRERVNKIKQDILSNVSTIINNGGNNSFTLETQQLLNNLANQAALNVESDETKNKIKQDTEIIVKHILKFLKKNVVIDGDTLVVDSGSPQLKSLSNTYNSD